MLNLTTDELTTLLNEAKFDGFTRGVDACRELTNLAKTTNEPGTLVYAALQVNEKFFNPVLVKDYLND